MQPDAFARKVTAPGLAEPPGATWSNCLVVGREIVMSGVTARGSDGKATGGDDMKAQARVIFERIEAMARSAGGGLHNVYKLVIYITDMTRKNDVNVVRSEVFRAAWPCSTLVEVKGFAFADLLIEIDAFANLDVDMHRLAQAS